MIRVLICDDQAIVCEGLQAILSTAPEIEVVGVANDGAQAVEMIPETQPDVVLMDLKMPVMNGVQATRRIRDQHPKVQVLVLTTYDADEWVFDAIRGGASGYLLKDTPREQLIEAIKATARGESFLQPSVAAKVVAEFARMAEWAPLGSDSLIQSLSSRELEVLRLIADGKTNREIAGALVIAEGTVKNHVTSILGKLGVRSRTEAALKARDLGLV